MTSLHSAPPRHGRAVVPLRIAMLGAPVSTDGGSGTAVEEIGRRLVLQGHSVTVYGCSALRLAPQEHLGMRYLTVPAAGGTLSRIALSSSRLLLQRRQDVVILFGTENAPFIPMIRSRGAAVAVHMDAEGWVRDRRRRLDRAYHRAAEHLAVRGADALITDAQVVRDAVSDDFGVPADLIRTGTRITERSPSDLVERLGLLPGHFHLAVAGSTPEHHLDVVVQGYHRSGARLPLVVVGLSRHRGGVPQPVEEIAARDPRIRLLGDVADQQLLDQLAAHAVSYLHGHAVGVTNPALLRAMGAGTAVLAWNSPLNREVVGTGGSYFADALELASDVEEVERYPFRFVDLGQLMQERARKRYDWDVATEQFEALASRLARGYSTRGMSSARRLHPTRASVHATVGAPRG